jgi:hypothetical protein
MGMRTVALAEATMNAAEEELRDLRSAVWRIVNEVDECHCVTTEGGDRFMVTDREAAAVRRALEANEPVGEPS